MRRVMVIAKHLNNYTIKPTNFSHLQYAYLINLFVLEFKDYFSFINSFNFLSNDHRFATAIDALGRSALMHNLTNSNVR